MRSPVPFTQYCRLNCVPQKEMFKAYALVSVNVSLFGNEIFADMFKMRQHWIRMGPNQIIDVLIRNLDRHTGRMPYDNGSRDQGYVATAKRDQGCQVTQVRREAWNRFSLCPSKN